MASAPQHQARNLIRGSDINRCIVRVRCPGAAGVRLYSATLAPWRIMDWYLAWSEAILAGREAR